MKAVYKSDIGYVRSVNEDRAVVQNDVGGLALAIVADGMGGHQAGEIASQMAIETIQEKLQTIHSGIGPEECERLLGEAIVGANVAIYEYASQITHLHGMGTTVVAALASEEWLLIAHIGDSRAYLIKGGDIAQLTEDHSLVNELLRSGQITKEEADRHPRRNVLTRALGTDMDTGVDIHRYPWSVGDVLLLCSDGLSALVDTGTIREVIDGGRELQDRADELVARALAAGGDDNVTVVLLENDADGLRGGRGDAG